LTDGVALYLRVSTEEQDLAGQERDLCTYAAAKGWLVVASYSEKVTATGTAERRQKDLLLSAARSPTRKWDHVLVWSIDRWSRDPSFVQAVGSIEELEKRGVSFHSFREPMLDTATDERSGFARDILRGILSTVAKFEARHRAERTRLAMREIKEGRRPTRSGRPNGRPRKVTPELAERALRLHREGRTWREVSPLVGLPPATCRDAAFRFRTAGRPVENPPLPERVSGSGETPPV
jgi:DNA invertase Pin-like site-specific DNA recombinase